MKLNLFHLTSLSLLYSVHASSKSNLFDFIEDLLNAEEAKYEIWGSDQSNSVSNESSKGVRGSFLWIWDSDSIQEQMKGSQDATPLSCTPDKEVGPCDLLDIFPSDLEEYDINGNPTNMTLGDLDGFGRLHGMLRDPQNRYVTANIFTPGGGYVGVIDTDTKEAVGLFRVTNLSYSSSGTTAVSRSVHMSFWSTDGSAIIVANLHGKAIERVDVTRDSDGVISGLQFNADASIGLGTNMTVDAEATYFVGNNAHGNPLIGSIVGDYSGADFGDLTPNGICKESGCGGQEPEGGARTNNVPICPITSSNKNAYVTLGGGGLLVLKHDSTPMEIVGEYGNEVINGAGCGGAQAGDQMFLNAGVSASSAGFDQSTFTVYSLDDTMYETSMAENTPMPTEVFKDEGNTNTIGNTAGTKDSDSTGQIPGETTRRDSHGAAATKDNKYVHVVDRIQNVVEVFDTETYERSTYDLVSKSGKDGREGGCPGACSSRSITDDSSLTLNDPAPDLMDITPDGKYFVIAFRGAAPVSVTHSAQGSCPGVGIVKITYAGSSGRLVDVLRATNTVDKAEVGTITGGHDYTGADYSDIHHATVIPKN